MYFRAATSPVGKPVAPAVRPLGTARPQHTCQ